MRQVEDRQGRCLRPRKRGPKSKVVTDETQMSLKAWQFQGFVARLLAAREKLAPDLVRGLQAIADEAAVDALISFANDELEGRRLLARGALSGIESKTNDAMIRQKIEQALK